MAYHSPTPTPTEMHDPVKETGYSIKRQGFYLMGKKLAHDIGELAAHNNTLGLATAFGNSAIGVVMVGLTAAISAVITQLDYVHRRDNIKDMYKEELSARLKKPVSQITDKDLDILAKENKVLGEEMTQIKGQRNIGVGVSFFASMAALAVGAFVIPPIAGAIAAAGASAGMASLGTIAAFAVKAAVALTAYNVVKKPLHHAADKLFHIDYTTTHDHIMSLKKEVAQGKHVTKEDVLSVYVASNPQLSQHIIREHGKHFDSLQPNEKSKIATELNKFIPLEALADGINRDKINVTELAFAVDGQMSGVLEGLPPEKPGIAQRFVEGCKKMLTPQKQEGVGADIAAAARHHDAQATAAFQQGSPARAQSREKQRMTHVERLEQQHTDIGVQQHI